jgi:hypothetical protein
LHSATGLQNNLFGAAQTAMSNDRDWRQIGGTARRAQAGADHGW